MHGGGGGGGGVVMGERGGGGGLGFMFVKSRFYQILALSSSMSRVWLNMGVTSLLKCILSIL